MVYLPGFQRMALETQPDGTPPALWALYDYRFKGCIWGRGDHWQAGAVAEPVPLLDWLEGHGLRVAGDKAARGLCAGGKDSLLARYAERQRQIPIPDWPRPLRLSDVREALAGDPRDVLRRLLAAPSNEIKRWGDERSLVLEQIAEEYGLTIPHPNPLPEGEGTGEATAEELADAFAIQIALTEAWDAFGRPADFPFLSRLPAKMDQRQRLAQFLREDIVSHTELAPRFRERMLRVEVGYNLATWPDESEAIKSRIQLRGRDQIIDKVSAALRETDDKYWARLQNAMLDFVNIDEEFVAEHDRLLMGGVWAEVTIRYDGTLKFKGATRPFFVEQLKPIQLSSRNIGPLQEARSQFTRAEWIDLLLRSLGMEPGHEYFTPRRKLLYITRLIPLVERNFNLVELGPRGTGKSFVYQQISPYCHLVSGGQTTVAQMFVNLASGQRGLVCLWDTVAFDEAGGIRFQDKNGINIMKNYMEDGTFSRGREIISAEGSIVFVGNLDGDVQTITRTSNLFYPMPKEMDTAFFDRIHCYLPGWELGKTRDEFYTSHFGFVSDYLAEVLRHLRKSSHVDLPERYFEFGSHVGGRDAKAVRKTVSGLVKLLHPDGKVAKEEVAEYIEFAMEMRRRVKEQLKKMGGLEYWDVNFSYVDRETHHQAFVPLPESGGGTVITGEPLPPGSVYTIGTDPSDRKLALFLIQTQINPGSGRIIPLGNLSPIMKEGLKAADAYLKAHIRDLGIDRDPKQYDFTVQAVNLNQAKEGAETAIAFFISMVSAILDRPNDPTTVVIGEMSVRGLLQKVSSLPERLELALESGAKKILIPSENKRDLADVPDETLNKLQPIFYTNPINAAIRAMGLE